MSSSTKFGSKGKREARRKENMKNTKYKHLTNKKKAQVFDNTITPEDEEIMKQHEVERQKKKKN